ncbi:MULTISPECIES: hypothetical protein [Flavobacteriaceae]|uniref:hypothetical protein n=1 Tax=Flavobacteriaceae TaxID=49546 RepID=UPI0035127A56
MKQNTDTQVSNINNKITVFRRLAWLSVIIGFIAFLIGIYLLICKNQDFNEVGDFVGGISGSLWALSGLFFIYIAFLGQKIEIKYQQEDLALTRKELEESREVFKAQAEIMSIQQIDNTFFNLLENHRKTIESISAIQTKNNGLTKDLLSGYQILETIYKDWIYHFKIYSEYQKTGNIFNFKILELEPIQLVGTDSNVKLITEEFQNVINFIETKVSETNKDFYVNTFLSSLNHYEKFLIEARLYFFENSKTKMKLNEFREDDFHMLKIKIPKLRFEIDHSNFDFMIEKPIKISCANLIIHDDFNAKIALFENQKLFKVIDRKNNLDNYYLDIYEHFELKNFNTFFLKKSHKSLALIINAKKNNYFFNYDFDYNEYADHYQYSFILKSNSNRNSEDIRFKDKIEKNRL